MTFLEISKQLNDIQPILIKLANRKRNIGNKFPDKVWYDFEEDDERYCYICQKNFTLKYIWFEDVRIESRIKSILEHGLQHLKEHNLLPFI